MAGPFIKPKYYGTRTTRGLPPKQYPGALDGSQAHLQKMPVDGERHPKPPQQGWITQSIEYLVDRMSMRLITEIFNLRMPIYQAPWVTPPYHFLPLTDDEGLGAPVVPFVPTPLPPTPIGTWITIHTITVPKGYRGIVNRYGFELSDPLGGPVNIPYETVQFRVRIQNSVIDGPHFGHWGSIEEPYEFPFGHVRPDEPLYIDIRNNHPGLTWNVASRALGWKWKIGMNAGKSQAESIVD